MLELIVQSKRKPIVSEWPARIREITPIALRIRAMWERAASAEFAALKRPLIVQPLEDITLDQVQRALGLIVRRGSAVMEVLVRLLLRLLAPAPAEFSQDTERTAPEIAVNVSIIQ